MEGEQDDPETTSLVGGAEGIANPAGSLNEKEMEEQE